VPRAIWYGLAGLLIVVGIAASRPPLISRVVGITVVLLGCLTIALGYRFSQPSKEGVVVVDRDFAKAWMLFLVISFFVLALVKLIF